MYFNFQKVFKTFNVENCDTFPFFVKVTNENDLPLH